MAIGSTVYLFQVDLSDVDRGVYTELELRPALHPSESAVSLVARVLAVCLEHDEQLRLGAGVGEGDEPAASIRDLTGRLQTWIDVGTPDATRLHKASKAADRVAVYIHKDPTPYLRELQGQKVHGSPKVHLYGLDRALVAALAERLDRRQRWALSRVDGGIYVEVSGETLSGELTSLPWG